MLRAWDPPPPGPYRPMATERPAPRFSLSELLPGMGMEPNAGSHANHRVSANSLLLDAAEFKARERVRRDARTRGTAPREARRATPDPPTH